MEEMVCSCGEKKSRSIPAIGHAEVVDYTGDSTRVIILSEHMSVPVTYISSSAFREKASTSVILSSNIVSIDTATFYNCTSLTSIGILDGVTSIGEYSFADCSRLTNILYRGSESQWNAIWKGTDWDYNTGSHTITYNYTEESQSPQKQQKQMPPREM